LGGNGGGEEGEDDEEAEADWRVHGELYGWVGRGTGGSGSGSVLLMCG
jgi:hypothetical protein